MKKLSFFFRTATLPAALILSLSLSGQQTDSLAVYAPPLEEVLTDSLSPEPEKTGFFNFKADYPNPKKAAFLSLALPGAGQIYNKRYWKLPLVYGALGGMVYLVDFNQSRFRRFRNALDLKRADMPHEFSGTRLDDVRTLRNLRDVYDKRTQVSYIGTVIVYALQAVEAFVDAHLKEFNVDDDLSLRLEPQIDMGPFPGSGPTFGIGLTVPLNGGGKAWVMGDR